MAFTGKQQAFINAYLIHRNATRAAMEAGYSKNTAHAMGWENLRKPEIKAAIEERFNAEAMSAAEVIVRLADQARGDMADVASLETAADIKASPYSRLIKEFERKIEFDRDGNRTETVKLKLYDAQAALGQLGRYHKLFVDRVQAEDDETRAVDDIRAGRIQFAALAEAFDEAYATRLFAKAGVPLPAR